jgi:hypothetical protein
VLHVQDWKWSILGYAGLFTIDLIGRSGGLAFMGMDEQEVDILNYSLRHISTVITLNDLDFKRKFTGFYDSS